MLTEQELRFFYDGFKHTINITGRRRKPKSHAIVICPSGLQHSNHLGMIAQSVSLKNLTTFENKTRTIAYKTSRIIDQYHAYHFGTASMYSLFMKCIAVG